jgi:hypothetical protein
MPAGIRRSASAGIETASSQITVHVARYPEALEKMVGL